MNWLKKFSPYVQLKKQDAVALLKDIPLSITDEDKFFWSNWLKNLKTDKIVNLYNNSKSQVKFECLPEEAQTVIASVAYQNGYLPSRTPDFWTQAVKQDWNAVYDNLMDFSDAFPTRREKEANLIKRLLWKNILFLMVIFSRLCLANPMEDIYKNLDITSFPSSLMPMTQGNKDRFSELKQVPKTCYKAFSNYYRRWILALWDNIC